MKNKTTLIVASLAVMMAMMGTAAANPFNLAITGGVNPQPLLPGNSIALDISGDTFADPVPGAHYDLTAAVAGVSGSNPNDVIVTFASGSPGHFNPISDPYTAVGELIISLRPTAPVGSKYIVSVFADPSTGETITIESADASQTITSIPEFPTVALPVVAVIGLVFFFHNRKRKEE
jgi:hypothetical protein